MQWLDTNLWVESREVQGLQQRTRRMLQVVKALCTRLLGLQGDMERLGTRQRGCLRTSNSNTRFNISNSIGRGSIKTLDCTCLARLRDLEWGRRRHQVQEGRHRAHTIRQRPMRYRGRVAFQRKGSTQPHSMRRKGSTGRTHRCSCSRLPRLRQLQRVSILPNTTTSSNSCRKDNFLCSDSSILVRDRRSEGRGVLKHVCQRRTQSPGNRVGTACRSVCGLIECRCRGSAECI
mmetsp:Transcript_30368/g.58377  ORF Transcript_30368/g.58377 Transcript_30368/m.58377 type:complete len:233 (+) Transcript_30368:2236-2934(+)